MICPKCGSNEIYTDTDESYISVFRCFKCNHVGYEDEFND